MEQPMRRSMRAGIIFHVSYPQLGGDEGPIPGRLERICEDGYLEAVEVTRMKDGQVQKKAVEMIHAVHVVPAYGGQSRTLSAGLSISDLDETRRAMVVDTLKEGIDEAYEMGCVGLPFLCGRYDEGRKEQAFEQLLKSTRRLCGYIGEKGNVPIYCKVFDYDTDKRALISPATLTAHYAGKIRRDYGNFGLLVDLSHIPMLRETIEENILLVKDYIIHAYMGNTMIRNPGCEAHGDDHPRSGFPGNGNDVEELVHYLRTLMEVGSLGEKKRSIVSFEVKPRKGGSPEVIMTNAKRTLNLAWELVWQVPAFDIYKCILSKRN